MNLETLAVAVKSNFETLQESEIVGRIMIISGRNFERSLKGFEMLIAGNHIPETFIEPETKGKLIPWLNRNPGLKSMLVSLDAIPGKMKLTEPQEITFLPPPKLSETEVLQRLSFSNLDF